MKILRCKTPWTHKYQQVHVYRGIIPQLQEILIACAWCGKVKDADEKE